MKPHFREIKIFITVETLINTVSKKIYVICRHRGATWMSRRTTVFHEFVRSKSANQQLSLRLERDVPLSGRSTVNACGARSSCSQRTAPPSDSLLPVPGSDLGVTTVFTGDLKSAVALVSNDIKD